MKRILANSFLMTGLLFLVNITYAQKKTSTPSERADKLTEWMKTNLQLTLKNVRGIALPTVGEGAFVCPMSERKSPSPSE